MWNPLVGAGSHSPVVTRRVPSLGDANESPVDALGSQDPPGKAALGPRVITPNPGLILEGLRSPVSPRRARVAS